MSQDNVKSIPRRDTREFIPGFIEVTEHGCYKRMIGIGQISDVCNDAERAIVFMTDGRSFTVDESYTDIKKKLVWSMLREAGDDAGNIQE